jgi:adenosylcobinamide kinase/adenosylcobinamide-phosphate guanylyltransferase
MFAGTGHVPAFRSPPFMTHLITGAARSGKSRYAEQLAIKHDGPVCYVATAEIRDAEFAERVRQHRLQQPSHWQVLEADAAWPS